MGVVPNDRIGKIDFYEAHLAAWTTSAVAIGLLPAAVTALTGAVAAARKAYDDHLAAQAAARAATNAFYNKVRLMHAAPGAGSDMIQTIKTFAQTTRNPNVYALAQIPAPAAASAAPPPGTPFDFNVGLRQDGSLDLSWKCRNPSGTQGTIYEIKRQIGSGPATFIGATGVKRFADDSLPPNASPCTYHITAVRSTTRGNPAQFTVSFGVGSGVRGEGFDITANATRGAKLAA